MEQNIKLNLNGVEAMIFFWKSVSERERVNEVFINDTSQMQEFQHIYDEEFSDLSLRTILSALTNREPYRGNKKEQKFYSNNLMMLEYIDELDRKISTIKELRVKELVEKLMEKGKEINWDEIIVIPSSIDDYYKKGNKIILNFFSLWVVEGKPVIKGKPIEDILEELLS